MLNQSCLKCPVVVYKAVLTAAVFIRWAPDGLFQTIDIICAATNCIAIFPSGLWEKIRKKQLKHIA